MIEHEILRLKEEVANSPINNEAEIESFRLRFISKKGEFAPLMTLLKDAPNEQKKELGLKINELKNLAETKFSEAKTLLEEIQLEKASKTDLDLTMPSLPMSFGSTHPIHQVWNDIVRLFERIGFSVAYDREIEDDRHNFTALNFPPNHPAREMQDTYFLDDNKNYLLRTHTSSVQVRIMENEKPPIRVIMPGRVYRNESISARSHCLFHQVEGLYISEKVSFKELKQTLYYFAKEFFGEGTTIRMRPSYFPFTEPSAEVDVTCFLCGGKGCSICKYSGWVEIGGCGMVDPNVLESCGIDSTKYSGFAFGMGIERITMLKYGIKDIRLFTENDKRFLSQFSHIHS